MTPGKVIPDEGKSRREELMRMPVRYPGRGRAGRSMLIAEVCERCRYERSVADGEAAMGIRNRPRPTRARNPQAPRRRRSSVRSLFTSSDNRRPDPAHNDFLFEIHGQANPIPDAALDALCHELNQTEVTSPGTHLHLVYRSIRSSASPRG